MSSRVFRVGITPDFFVEAKGRFEQALESKLGGLPGLEWASMESEPLDAFDAIFALKINLDDEILSGVKRTAVVARWGVGYDTIDTAALTRRDVALAITPGAVRRPVAEAILTFVFALGKNLREQDRITSQGSWRGELASMGSCLEGKTLASVGFGNIAQQLFSLASSLGFGRMVAYDPLPNRERAAELGVELVALEDVFREGDYVTVNTLLNADTLHLVDARLLALMKPTAFLINTARGPIVDEAALIEALRGRRIAGAGLDVLEQEPPDPANPLPTMDNALVTPHGLAWTEELARDNSLEACENMLAVYRGQPPPGIVNREVLERSGFQAKLDRFREANS